MSMIRLLIENIINILSLMVKVSLRSINICIFIHKNNFMYKIKLRCFIKSTININTDSINCKVKSPIKYMWIVMSISTNILQYNLYTNTINRVCRRLQNTLIIHRSFLNYRHFILYVIFILKGLEVSMRFQVTLNE